MWLNLHTSGKAVIVNQFPIQCQHVSAFRYPEEHDESRLLISSPYSGCVPTSGKAVIVN